MNTSAGEAWSQPEQQHHLDPMAQLSSADLDDLGNLFDFGDIDLNPIPDVHAQQQYADSLQHTPQHLSHPGTPYHDVNGYEPPHAVSVQDFGGQEPYGQQQHAQYMSQPVSQAPTSNPYTSESLYPSPMQQPYLPQQHSYQFQQQHGYPAGSQIPHTPNSFEMHGEAGRFLQHQQPLDPQQRAIIEQRYGLRKDDATTFTPMASPADTPQYNVQSDFTLPGAYFSPLTSPMLHAQTGQNGHQLHHHQQGYYTNPSTAPSSSATSPIDPNLDVDMLGDAMALPESALRAHRSKRTRAATPKGVVAMSRAKERSIQKPHKRKSHLMMTITPGASDHRMDEAPRSAGLTPTLQVPAAFHTSSEDSVSPEPLSESVMGPPPRPGSSLHQSPALSAQQEEAGNAALGAAATPKSLLSRGGNQQSGRNSGPPERGSGGISTLDELQLPEAAAGQPSRGPSLTQINTQVTVPCEDGTPRMAARKTPKLGPLSTPSSARPGSALASPSVMQSPVSATTPGALLKDKKDGKGARGNKKRGSTGASSSHLASPALRPRISPSIKPLLPEGTTLHSPTHALLLASKSNYQNLVEGNHLPGVSYPDSLSTGLTSKRTSHKVAEQGRRNRINEALKEMQSLLPKEYLNGRMRTGSNGDESPEAVMEIDAKESKEDAAAKSNSSKAATVESANVYIRNTQKKQAEMAEENEALKKRLAEIEARLIERQDVVATSEKADGSGAAVGGGSPASAKSQS